MTPVCLLAAAVLGQAPPATQPSPDHPFFRELLIRAGETALGDSAGVQDAVRVVRVPEALVAATVVTVMPTKEGATLRVHRLADRRAAGATLNTFTLTTDEWQEARHLAHSGLWNQAAVRPSDRSPTMTDGVLWFLEGLRDGQHSAIVRHDPLQPEVAALCSFLMFHARLPEKEPR
jgi:hypothetical protein